MCCNFKFVVHEMNSEIVKSGMVVLTGREMADMDDTDVAHYRKNAFIPRGRHSYFKIHSLV
jgi:hypothetical protein